MQTKRFHISILGKFASRVNADADGYVTIHDHGRYSRATKEQLERWLKSRIAAVRSAAATEMAERDLQIWRVANVSPVPGPSITRGKFLE